MPRATGGLIPTKSAFPFQSGFAPNSVNFIRKLIFHECSIPFQVYVETFIPCFINLVMFITLPEFNDFIREHAEGLTSSGARGRKRRKGHLSSLLLPEPIGKGERRAQQGLKLVLNLTAPLETIGYAMLLYAGTERFYYQWNSALYGFEHCGKPPSEGPYQAHTDEIGLPVNTGNLPLFTPIVDQNRAGWPATTFSCTVPRGHYQVTLEASFESLAVNDSEIEISISALFGLAYDSLESGSVTMKPKGGASCVVSAHVYFPFLTGGTIGWLYRGSAVPVGITIKSASISIFSFQPGR